jgi:hypothetical protein
MDTSLTLFGVLDALFFFGGISSLIVLPGWLQKRHREVARRQIRLTDALDAECGPVVAPVVKKPLWGPWRIEIAVPFAHAATVGQILAVAHEVLAVAEGMSQNRYRFVLTVKPGNISETRMRRSVERWATDRVVAA